ncbi:DUF4382 domain-containing protein [Photobacterium gaetbulicola]|uniref:Putative lipoprotein n=1 Tax=Photobacterium gaetbulicola Gung47 TaxID=658445 RepID=A0A0C5WQB8_9GAMM|nr:DUF4382 domain-containing protein [Photobacterium gaetbulicola]AJR05150.1 putative lipoprotein [Photobacterium gaetbulicola Gung47]PSU06826.1 DUF4382 domain-containing protein [Photobacterium gaetbulicola]
MKSNKLLLPLVLSSILVGCGSDNNDNGGNVPGPTDATLNFGVINQLSSPASASKSLIETSDYSSTNCNHGKCLDDIDEAVIAFNYVYLKKVNGNGGDDATCDQTGECEAYHITFEQEANELRMIDVMNANGDNAYPLFQDLKLSPGDYEMCLYINGKYESGTQVEVDYDSHVRDIDGSYLYLTTPSQGSCAGAKPPQNARPTGRLVSQPFTVQKGYNNLAFWFNLEETLQYNKNHDWRFLGNKDFEIVHVDDIAPRLGHIRGTIDIDTIQSVCHDNNLDAVDAVYLYRGATEQSQMLGFHDPRIGNEGERRPVELAAVAVPLVEDPSGMQAQFSFSDVYAGEYAVGYTCTAQHDTEEANGSGFEIYDSINNIIVEPGRTIGVTFSL